MKAASLFLELREAITSLERDDIDQLRGLGIPETIISHEMIGISRIRATSDNLYEADPDGSSWAYISPVCVHRFDTPESTLPHIYPFSGHLIDLVAWDERTPRRWRLRVGAAAWLGCIEPQYCEPGPVRVWRSPLSWLRHGCTGIVPLAQERGEIYRLLSGCSGGITAEDPAHQAELRAILARPWPAPRVRHAA